MEMNAITIITKKKVEKAAKFIIIIVRQCFESATSFPFFLSSFAIFFIHMMPLFRL